MDLLTIPPVNLKIDETLPTDLRDWSSSVEKNSSTHKPAYAEESHSGEKDTNDIKVTKYTNLEDFPNITNIIPSFAYLSLLTICLFRSIESFRVLNPVRFRILFVLNPVRFLIEILGNKESLYFVHSLNLA